MNTRSELIEIGRTGVTFVLLLATLRMSGKLGARLADSLGVGGLARGATGPWLFAVSGFVGLCVLYAGYVWYYAARS
jgi:hypothetical protein